jgi:MATE family multidrug resistance protein
MSDLLPFENTLSRHVRRTLVLAWPMILTRVGIVAMSAIDVIVLGRAGADQLADLVLGQAVYDSMIGMTIGLLLGVPVLVARETGAGNDAASGAIWARGLVFRLVLGLALCAVLQFAYPVFIAAGQDPELARRAARVTAILGLALPGIATYYVSAAWLEALHQPGAALFAVLLANLSNLALNIVFVFGWGPFPAMGAHGVCQTSCPPISCSVSDFRGAVFALWVDPDVSGGLPVARFS